MTHQTDFIYVAPGQRQCRVYHVPQSKAEVDCNPRDVASDQRQQWKHVATLDDRLDILTLSAEYRHLKNELTGAMPGDLVRIHARTLHIIT